MMVIEPPIAVRPRERVRIQRFPYFGRHLPAAENQPKTPQRVELRQPVFAGAASLWGLRPIFVAPQNLIARAAQSQMASPAPDAAGQRLTAAGRRKIIVPSTPKRVSIGRKLLAGAAIVVSTAATLAVAAIPYYINRSYSLLYQLYHGAVFYMFHSADTLNLALSLSNALPTALVSFCAAILLAIRLLRRAPAEPVAAAPTSTEPKPNLLPVSVKDVQIKYRGGFARELYDPRRPPGAAPHPVELSHAIHLSELLPEPLAAAGVDFALKPTAEAPSSALNPGDTLYSVGEETYTIVSLLGIGGMGNVYKCQRASDGALVAVKIVPQDLIDSLPASRDSVLPIQRMADERRCLAKITDKAHIEEFYDYGFYGSPPLPFIVVEFIEGHCLSHIIRQLTEGMDPVAAVYIASQMIDGLRAAASQGIVHRDVKPDNTMVTNEGVIKLIDFGLAKALDGLPSAAHTQTGAALGTPEYMDGVFIRTHKALEAGLSGDEKVALHTLRDKFALGITLYELLTKETSIDLAHLYPKGIPQPIMEIIAQLTHNDIAQRHHDTYADLNTRLWDALFASLDLRLDDRASVLNYLTNRSSTRFKNQWEVKGAEIMTQIIEQVYESDESIIRSCSRLRQKGVDFMLQSTQISI